MRAAFVGVGAIGLPMARRLLPHHEVTVYDLAAERIDRLVADGAAGAPSPRAAGAGAEIAIVMVADPGQLRTAVLDESDGLLAGLAPGSLLIVMSSVGVAAIHELRDTLAGTGVDLLDVPVTGGVVRARTGELTLLAGGPAELVRRAAPVLRHLGTVATCGVEPGDGQAVKLVNQLLCSVHLAAAGEALALAGALGLDPAAVLRIVGSGAASSFMLLDRGPRMLSATPPPVLSSVDIFVKDSMLVAEAARRTGTPTPLLDAAGELFRTVSGAGGGRLDDSSVITAYDARGTGR